MGRTRIVLLLAALAATAGCTISRHIVEREPVRQPPLTDLEQHLDYADPDDGRPDFVIEAPQ